MTHTLVIDFWNVIAFSAVNGLRYNQALLRYLGTLSIPCHIFSNSPSSFLESAKPKLVPPCTSVLSAKALGLSKSDPSSYKSLSQMLETPTNTIIFVDDQSINIEAARAAGLQTILFESTDQLIRKLNSILI